MMPKQDSQLLINGREWGVDARIELEDMLLNYKVVPRKAGNPRGKSKINYCNILSAFDIETTTLLDIKQAFMYLWQWAFVNLDSGEMLAIYGRTWDEWRECAYLIRDTLPPDITMVVLDHNLNFEFHFLRDFVPFCSDDVFATDTRAVVKCRVYDRMEFRCTLRHSNTSLKTYLEQWNVDHKKMSGEDFGYTKIRYPWTPLTENEIMYGLHDVVGLLEAYISEMRYWHDDLYSVPMTSTGYVRRDCKKAWSRINYTERINWMPQLEVIDLMTEAFRGGDTHACRYYSTPEDCDPLIFRVQSWDRSSSYPDVLINCQYPLGDWYRLDKKGEWVEREIIEKYIQRYEKAVVCRVHFKGLRLKNKTWGFPYIPKSKAGYYENILEDNGRILNADYLSMTITDVDWRILAKEYDYTDVYFSDVYYCRYRDLPDFFRDVVRGYYRKKTALKGAEPGSLEEIEMRLSKALLNACYGMAAQHQPIENIIYDNGEYVPQITYEIMQKEQENGPMTANEKKEYRQERRRQMLERVNKNAFLPYSIGVWCTAWARLELHRILWEVYDHGTGRAVYVDTDSCKFTGDCDLSQLNEYYKTRSEKNGAFADDRNGKRHYMGVYEYEYTADFCTMGAKKYVYQPDGDEHLHITIAGVGKKAGAQYLEKCGGMTAFRTGLVFDGENGGGLAGVYNDTPFGWIEKEGHKLYIGANLCLMPDSYTLGMAGDYSRLLDEITIYGEITGKGLEVGL